MIYAVFSIGQFVASDLDKLKKGFTNWFNANEIDKTGDDVWAWLTASGHLKSMRLGKMTVSQLRDSFNVEFKADMNFTDFSNIFNSMCTIDAEGLKRIQSFKEYLYQHDNLQFVLISHTNFSHLNYILSQIGPLFGKGDIAVIQNAEPWNPKAKLVLATSMSSQCEMHPDTLNFALAELKVSNVDTLASFLNTIQHHEHPHFSYADPGKFLEKVPALLEGALQPQDEAYRALTQ